MENLNSNGNQLPIRTAKNVYKRLCGDMNTAPINIFKHFKDTELSLSNYPLNNQQAKPIAFIMPFIQDMRKLIMKDCNLSDMAGSLIVESALRHKRLHKLDLKGMEMGVRFI